MNSDIKVGDLVEIRVIEGRELKVKVCLVISEVEDLYSVFFRVKSDGEKYYIANAKHCHKLA